MKIGIKIALGLFFCCLGCKEKKMIQGYEEKAWKSDKMGCQNKRSVVADFILANKSPWLGLDDDEIVELLGRPERSYYYERNVRAFGYYIQKGKQCNKDNVNFGKRLIVEFNATGYSKRIYFEID